jgi:hypothetical protein
MDRGGVIPSCAQQLEVFVRLYFLPLPLGGRVGRSEIFFLHWGCVLFGEGCREMNFKLRGIPLNTSHAVTHRFLQMSQRPCLLVFIA